MAPDRGRDRSKSDGGKEGATAQGAATARRRDRSGRPRSPARFSWWLGLEDRRDAAILYLLADTGIRLGELGSLRAANIDRGSGVVVVFGKGSKARSVPYSKRTAVALDRYLRRARHKDADLPWLWLSLKGRMTDSGISQMVKRRGAAIGIKGLHPHRFRHTFAHMWLAAGGQEGDLQRIAGWADRQMLGRYRASAAHQRP